MLDADRMAAATLQNLIKCGIQEVDAKFLTLDNQAWTALERPIRKLQHCNPPFEKCMQCEGCRLRFAIYGHRVYSAAELFSRLESMTMLGEGTKLALRMMNQELEAEQSQIPLTAAPFFQLDFHIYPNGDKICISCNHVCNTGQPSLSCLGCPAQCHLPCWRKSRHDSWQSLVFVCQLCRGQKADLNKRVQFPPEKCPDSLTASNEHRCLDCNSEVSPGECVICVQCAGCYCGETCANLGLKNPGRPFPTPQHWRCPYCDSDGQEVATRLESFLVPMFQLLEDEDNMQNIHAMSFVQMMTAVIDQRHQKLIQQFMPALHRLIELEVRKAQNNLNFLMSVEPMQLLGIEGVTESQAFACADNHARDFYSKATGKYKPESGPVPASSDGKKRVGVLTSDWRLSHPTREMLQGVFLDLRKECDVEVIFFLLEPPTPDVRQEMEAIYEKKNIILLKRFRKDETMAKSILDSSLDTLLFLDGHTGNGRGVFAEVEKSKVLHKLALDTMVWCAYPGVYGNSVSRTLLDRTVSVDKSLYAEAKTGELTCYHLTSGQLLSRNQLHQEATLRGFSREKSGIPSFARVLGFAGRLSRFTFEAQTAYATLAKMDDSVYIYLVAHTTTFRTVLNIYCSLCSLGVNSNRIIIGQALDPSDNELRFGQLVDVAGDIKGYGMHSQFSMLLRMGIGAVTIVDGCFHNNVGASILRSIDCHELCVNNTSEYIETLRKMLFDQEFKETVKAKLTPEALRLSPVFNTRLGSKELANIIHLALKTPAIQHLSLDGISDLPSGVDQPADDSEDAGSLSDNLLTLIERDGRWQDYLDVSEVRDRIKSIDKCLQAKAPSTVLSKVLSFKKNGSIVICGSALVGTGIYASRQYVAIKASVGKDQVVVKTGTAVTLRQKLFSNAKNRCFPKPIPILRGKSDRIGQAFVSNLSLAVLVTEAYEPWMETLLESVRIEFTCHGRISQMWQQCFYHLFDSICYLRSEGLVHGNLSAEHVMRDPANNRMVLVGFGHASSEPSAVDTITDIIAAAMMLLEPLLPTDSRRQERDSIIHASFQIGDLSSWSKCVLELYPQIVQPIAIGSGAHILMQIVNHPKDSNPDSCPVQRIRQGSVESLLELVKKMLHPSAGEKQDAEQAFLSGFLVDYIPDTAENERQLVTEGMKIFGKAVGKQKGIEMVPKDSLVLLVPNQGLQAVALFNTAQGWPVGYYAGVFETPGQNNDQPSAHKNRHHILPVSNLGLDGGPGGPILCLKDLVENSAPGSLFASSLQDPNDTRLDSGNVAIPERNSAKLERMVVPGADVRGVMMFSSVFIEYGMIYSWPYNWARLAGKYAFSEEEIGRRKNFYGLGLPLYTKAIIRKQRDMSIAAGGRDDPLPNDSGAVAR